MPLFLLDRTLTEALVRYGAKAAATPFVGD
jgi:hypothetical protein